MLKTRVTVVAMIVVVAGLIAYRVSDDESGSALAPVPRADPYVGVATCAECHPHQAQAFAGSGHSRTFRVAADSPEFDWLSSATFHDDDRDVEFRYVVDDEGIWAKIPEELPDREFPLQFALGSGMHAVTFLSLIPNDRGETVGVEHRVSVFPGQELRRTPGAASLPPQQEVEYFGNLLAGDKLIGCVDCHTTTFRIENAAVADLRPHVQCERCHGPGRDHVSAVESGQSDLKLAFVPGQPTALDEIQMCGICHRVPEMLSDTPLERTDAKLARYQPVGLLQSRCYTESAGMLRCTTCHDPHAHASARATSDYERQCAACHERHTVAKCSVSDSGCIACHMPRVEVHPGIAFHDHWIRVRQADDPRGAPDE